MKSNVGLSCQIYRLLKRVMNNLIRFKMKMLILLSFCIFMTFSMLVYVMTLTEKCENSADELCFQVSKNPIIKSNYFLYHVNYTQVTRQLLKPSAYSLPLTREPTTTTKLAALKTKRTTRNILRVFNISLNTYNFSSSKQVPSVYSVSPEYFFHAVGNHSTKQASSSLNVASNQSIVEGSMNAKAVTPVYNSSKKYNFSNILIEKSSDWQNSSWSFYSVRHKNLQQSCRKYFNISLLLKIKKFRLNHILIDEKHKLLYCYVPKVACTNWKRIFLILTGRAQNMSDVINLPSNEVHSKNLFKSLQNYSLSEAEEIIKGYTKFIFVRHPFERLLSAYRNKLEQHYDSSKYFQARFGKYIIKNFRKNPSNVSLQKGDDVTFAEFANYLISTNPSLYNEHWQRVADLCHPCLIKYDFIGKYENLIEDSNFLLRYLGVNLSFPVLPKPSTTALNLKKYFSTLDKATIFKLFSIYEMDFRLFGYNLTLSIR